MNEEQNDPIATLIRAAGKRPQVDAERLARVRAAVHDEWRDAVGARRRTRWLAVAAAAVLALVAGAIALIPRDEVFNATVRVEPGARFTVESPTVATLTHGTIYVDVSSPSGVTIRTPFGDVRDIGTKFEVRVSADDIRVRVDEGSVSLRETIAVAGETLTATHTRVERITPPIRLEGQRLDDVLQRVARAKRLTLDWRASASRRSVILHGDVPFTPDEALDAATVAARVVYRIEGDRLVIEEKP